MVEKLSVEDKLALAHFYSVSCLSDEERARKIKDLQSKGYSLGKLSLLWRVPKTTLHGWSNPVKKREVYAREKGVGKSSLALKVCDNISQRKVVGVEKIREAFSDVPKVFDFNSWVVDALDNIKVTDIPMTQVEKKNFDLLLLRLNRIRRLK